MTLPNGPIKCNCPACLEPEALWLSTAWSATGGNPEPNGTVMIKCSLCGFYTKVPPGPNPAQEVALEIIGANELGEKQEGDRRLIVHKGEAMDVIPADERETP